MTRQWNEESKRSSAADDFVDFLRGAPDLDALELPVRDTAPATPPDHSPP